MKKIILISLFVIITIVSFGQGLQYGNGYSNASGSITTQNLNPLTGVPTAGSFVRLTLANQSTAVITVSGTYTGALSLQYSTDGGSTWVTITYSNQLILATTAATSATIASAAVGAWFTNVSGLTDIRVSALAAVTGTAVVNIRAVGSAVQTFVQLLTSTNSIGNIATVTTVTTLSQFLAAAAAADATANPTTTGERAFLQNYNSSTWDRNYNNYNTTTGDAGAKVASFAGATQTNFNAKGATVTVLCGTVSGTLPTLTAQLQFSPDAGTTWLSVGGASGTVTTTGNTIVFQIYPTNFSVAGATPAALTTGGTQTVQLNTTLPRTWRLNYTITGTTPSFTLTGVYVNYQL